MVNSGFNYQYNKHTRGFNRGRSPTGGRRKAGVGWVIPSDETGGVLDGDVATTIKQISVDSDRRERER